MSNHFVPRRVLDPSMNYLEMSFNTTIRFDTFDDILDVNKVSDGS